tara:strand:+ start:3399 stop:4181 length:783 start_codon:yes stop_codon:yes gene_type:complete
MKTTFVIISVSDRVDQLNELLKTIIADSRWDDIDVNLLFQDPSGVEGMIEHRERYENIFVYPKLLGCHGARVTLLNKIKYDTYINLDDDMLLGGYTNYHPAIKKTKEKGVGFVLTNWAKTPELLAKKVPKKQDKFVSQILVYNGGGMVYSNSVADYMRALPIIDTAFDVAWPLTAYVEGYNNYRYLGSLSVHRVCGRGGMSAYMTTTKLHVMCGEYLTYFYCKRRKGNCHDVHIPLDQNVNDLAREKHRANRLARFNKTR